MGISLMIPLAAHMLIVRPRALWAHRYSLAAIGAAALWLAWPYWTYLAGPRPAAPGAGPAIAGWLFPLFGGRLLSARGLDYFYGPGPMARLLRIAATFSSIGYALVWCGIAVAIALMSRPREIVSGPRGRTLRRSRSARSCARRSSMASRAKFEHPHYHNGTWISVVLLAWFAVDFLATGPRGARWGRTRRQGSWPHLS